MADIIENEAIQTMKDYRKIPSNEKTNAALALGIIGTAMGVLGTGVGAAATGRRGWNNWGGNWNNGVPGYGFSRMGTFERDMEMGALEHEELNLERKEWKDYIDITKQFYEGKLENQERLADAFLDAYKRDVDNSFALYKSQRDADDCIRASVGAVASSLNDKIENIDKKVDMMAAVRPYQDALINCKIDNNALIAAYELQKRTCRMIQGELVLPSTPTVTGYPSYIGGCQNLAANVVTQ